MAALRRQVGAGKQGLSLTEEAYRVGIVLPQILEPAFESTRGTGVDAVVHARGDPEVGVGVRLVEEDHDRRGVYRGELYVFPKPLLYLSRSLSLGGQVDGGARELSGGGGTDLVPGIGQGYQYEDRAQDRGEDPRAVGATGRGEQEAAEPDGRIREEDVEIVGELEVSQGPQDGGREGDEYRKKAVFERPLEVEAYDHNQADEDRHQHRAVREYDVARCRRHGRYHADRPTLNVEKVEEYEPV
ncbi:hypothetical protein AVDCRST_MAG82-3046 [uncultured Rubrobacteraceae bacterium]|uniref:Uncharacterized protein n=1 Tax=uncultured Rubrobacteraceae bacterium TaxID=349277 RepID=A0A6J4QFJ6_9ACTN|nr:hypothetical protein AVDCRST_MAG82-3046 [uncultured Rubrobacteraceae bacterium]